CRKRIIEAGFKPLAGETPIIPIIVGETSAAIQMSDLLLDEGVFVTGFGFPVVPQGQARIRCQISAAHTRDDLDEAVTAFIKVGTRLKLICQPALDGDAERLPPGGLGSPDLAQRAPLDRPA